MGDWIDEVVEVFSDALDVQTKQDRGLHRGDIVGVDRGLYEHYAVYVGDDRVIHYAGAGDDIGGDVAIRESPFRDFLGEETTYFVCEAGYTLVDGGISGITVSSLFAGRNR